MIFIICFSVAMAVLITTAISALAKKDNKLITAGAGVFIAMFLLFIPAGSGENISNAFTEIIVPLVRSIRVFGLNEDFLASEFNFGELPLWFNITYICVLDLLYFIAPILTFGLILSIFGDISSKIRLLLSVLSDIYVFSDNNTRSRIIAEDIKKKKPHSVIVFFNSGSELTEKKEKAITFSGDVSGISPTVLKLSKHITFYICSDDENTNIKNTLDIINIIKKYPKMVDKLKENKNDDSGIDLFYFSSREKSIPVLSGIDNCELRIRKINEIQNVIYNFMYDNYMLKYVDNKEINVAVIGAGKYGEEFVKAALWSGQDLRYKLNINVFDIKNIEEPFSLKYPELVNTERLSDVNEISYKINFFDKKDIFETKIEDIAEMKSVKLVFVAVGDDDKNLEASVYLRECFSRMDINPEIHTIITDEDLNSICTANYKKSYNIDFILPQEYFIHDETMELEQMGRKMHEMWETAFKKDSSQKVDYSKFYGNDYNYRSSIAAAMFWRIRLKNGENVELSEGNKRLEHWRWSAYMRAEGFRYGKTRNNMAKLHNDLIPYGELKPETKTNDEYPIRTVNLWKDNSESKTP